MVTALDVAKLLIYYDNYDNSDRCENSDLSNLKLQKLLWYSQGFHLALTGKKLFGDTIEAWAHGPVVPDVYHEYKHCGRNPIDLDVPRKILRKFSEDELDIIEEVYDVFGKYSAWKLRNMTHEEKPWIDNEDHAGEIAVREIKSYFKTRLK